MHHKWLTIIFLLCSFAIHAMEITIPNNSSGLEIIMDDFLTTLNCLPLNREVRHSLRCASKKCLKLVFSQDDLNVKYIDAYKQKNQHQMDCWRSFGGCFYYQEFANAVKNKKDKLAEWLLKKNKVTVGRAYCSNIMEAVQTSTVDEMVPVIQWLLYTRTPSTYGSEFSKSVKEALRLVKEYPEAQKFLDLFNKYKAEELRRELQRRMIAQACSGLSIASCYGSVSDYF